jgi:uncharacterized damage-inducible protein DinB
MSEIRRILGQMDNAFSGEAWHGPALLQLLDGVRAEQASKHPIAGGHSIWELLNHIGAWNRIVRQRIAGEKVEVTPEMDWPPVWEASEVEWARAQQRLKEDRKLLRAAVEKLSEERLGQKIEGEKQSYSLYVMLHGLVQHDLYHAGQIAILKKALG